MKKVLYLFAFVAFMSAGLTSCSKDDDGGGDLRDQYVGTWSGNQKGSMTLFHSGQSIGTVPIDEHLTVEITKVGENKLNIGGTNFTVSGNNLSAEPENITATSDGINMVGVATASGSLNGDVIVINSDVTGSWSSENGLSGNFSGTTVTTLRR